MPQALPYPEKLTQDTSRKWMNRVLSAELGDGYTVEAPDGMNPNYDVYDLVYEPMTSAERDATWGIFRLVGAYDYLTWTPIGYSGEKKWKIVKDSVTESYFGSYYLIRLQVRQFF
jgi:phage-related protein